MSEKLKNRHEELKGWTEAKQMRGIWRIYALFISPDERKSAIVSLEDGSIIAIYDRGKKEMEYAAPTLIKGLTRLHRPTTCPLFLRDLGALIAKGARCDHCKVMYTSVEDFIERNPRRGEDPDLFVDSFCWDAYQEKRKKEKAT